METILRDLQEECRRLGEEAAKKIEEKYVGKGAVILSEVHELDKSSKKAEAKYYTILKPNKICSDVLTLQSDSKFIIKILKYAKKDESSENKVIISLRKQICTEVFHRVLYNDTIRFIDEQVIDELVEEIKSSIPSDIILVSAEDDSHTIARWCSTSIVVKPSEKLEASVRFAGRLKKELEDYLNEK